MSSTFSGDETAPFFGFLGAAAALVFSCMGAAYGTAKSGVGVASMGVMRPELVMKSIVPVVMAGVLGIYGLIIAVIISTGINPKAKSYYLFDGYAHLSSGLACGLAGLSAGMAIGIVGDAGVRANAQQPKLFVGMILILIFAEALALYGLIVGIILSSRADDDGRFQLIGQKGIIPSECRRSESINPTGHRRLDRNCPQGQAHKHKQTGIKKREMAVASATKAEASGGTQECGEREPTQV
ncbi:hypothetical protein NC653_005850 [Populus alba x Populus x berolinensis]|uniref:V-type proton ATPase proteolipid subunit n=2 Tax=Populus TaxID=3689 RepID=A0A4U5R6V7_POPAL|nr:hypothetical protein NC653_005850 [Populus alba x Populus x berolinensis]TKS18587.1 hypothetical protein D5086_0000002560 [Populus alba]